MSTKGRKPNADFMKLVAGGKDDVAVLPESAVDDTDPPAPEKPKGSASSAPDIKWPKSLVGNKVAQNEYVRIVKELRTRRKWLESFSGGIAIYAMAFADWIEAEKELAAEGKVIKSPKNYPIQSPWLAIRNRSQETMMKVANDYGLTLVSQVRIVDAQLDLFPSAEKKGPDNDTGGTFARFGR